MKKNDFILKANLKHNNKYDYSLLPDEVLSGDKVFILCPKHGKFEQKARYHISGQGCKKCANEKLKKSKAIDTKEFIERARKIHGDYYDYSLVDYIDGRKKIKIICPKHGEFEQIAKLHLYGSKCPKCVHDSYKKTYKLTTKQFIERAKKIHGDYYDYSLVDYVDNLTVIKIICPKHGEFKQKPREHIQGKGCCKCSTYKTNPEKDLINFIKNHLGVNNIIENDRNILNGQELDIYLPENNLAIEYNGLYYHSDLFVDKKYHLNKTEICERKNIQLIHIFEDEWLYKKNIVKSIIENKLKLNNNKIYARKCVIKEINNNELIRNFLNENHIQGFVGSKIKVGLFYNDELVSLMTFGKKRKFMNSSSKTDGEYELIRFCNKLNTSVIGGASKLFKYFIKNYKPSEVVSYADRRYSNGDLYKKLNMDYVSNTKPNFFYIKNQIRYSRASLQKHKLKNKFKSFNSEISVNDFLKNQGFDKIYDSGNVKFIYK